MDMLDITVQEVSESMFHKFDSVLPPIQRKLGRLRCINCGEKLSGEVNYVILPRKVIKWWHQVCPALNK